MSEDSRFEEFTDQFYWWRYVWRQKRGHGVPVYFASAWETEAGNCLWEAC